MFALVANPMRSIRLGFGMEEVQSLSKLALENTCLPLRSGDPIEKSHQMSGERSIACLNTARLSSP